MNLEELCALRDQFIMDPNYSQKQKDFDVWYADGAYFRRSLIPIN